MESTTFQIKTALFVFLFSALAQAQGLSRGGYGFGGNAVPDPYYGDSRTAETAEEIKRAGIRSPVDVEDGTGHGRPLWNEKRNETGGSTSQTVSSHTNRDFPVATWSAKSSDEQLMRMMEVKATEYEKVSGEIRKIDDAIYYRTYEQGSGTQEAAFSKKRDLVKQRSQVEGEISAIKEELNMRLTKMSPSQKKKFAKTLNQFASGLLKLAPRAAGFMGIVAVSTTASANENVTEADITGLGSGHSRSGQLIAGDQENKSSVLQRFKIQPGSSGAGSSAPGNGQK